MPVDPMTLALISGGASALGGAFSGNAAAKASRQQIAEQIREFNLSGAMGPTRALETLPLRDRILYLMNQRLGANPTTNVAAQNSYTPGAGGTNPALYQK